MEVGEGRVVAVGVGEGVVAGGGGVWDGRDDEIGVAFHSFSFFFFQTQRNM